MSPTHPVGMLTRALLVRMVIALVLGAAAIMIAVLVGVPEVSQLRAAFGGGLLGGLVFSGLYAAVALSPLPKTVFTVAAGALFGVLTGVIVVLAGATVGALAAFSLGRWLGRDVVHRLTRIRAERFDEHLARRGLGAVLVLRLVPLVPFTALNYLAGLTALRLRDFLLGTLIGMVPATTAAVTLGAYGTQPGSWPFLTAAAALLVLTALGLLAAARRRRAGRALPGDPRPAAKVTTQGGA